MTAGVSLGNLLLDVVKQEGVNFQLCWWVEVEVTKKWKIVCIGMRVEVEVSPLTSSIAAPDMLLLPCRITVCPGLPALYHPIGPALQAGHSKSR